MNTAWSATVAIWSPLQSLLRWLAPGQQAMPTAAVQVLRPATPALAVAHRVASRPLRVVRVMEDGQTRSQVGRMVISGRMADVCAELDRLAACEAARS